jgi:hypothetical protein
MSEHYNTDFVEKYFSSEQLKSHLNKEKEIIASIAVLIFLQNQSKNQEIKSKSDHYKSSTWRNRLIK